MPRVALRTLGCKVNQYETEKIAEEFRDRGYELVSFSEQADVYVVNSCTVTATADSKSRQAARSAAQRNPGAIVVLTGCYADTSPEQARAVHGVDLVVGNPGKAGLVDAITELLASGGHAVPDRSRHEERTSLRFRGRTRALLKVQDGCNQFCSYCAVPLARPVMESRPLAEVLSEAETIAAGGFKEIVLTGIRLGRYESNGENLRGLVRRIAELDGIERIRLSSIELTDIPGGLLDLMAENSKVCRHLHIPLQSGDDAVLARMNRPYTVEEFRSFVNGARSRVEGIAITTDIMVGFPGETEQEFENTYRLAEEIRFARTHVFRFSPRPRTAAFDMKDDVSAREKERRSALLIEQAGKHSEAFARTLVGKTVPILVESRQSASGMWSGFTDNYVRVGFESSGRCVGKIVHVSIESVSNGMAFGSTAGR